MPKEKAEQKTKTLDVTINLHKLCHRITFKKKAKRAISEIKQVAGKMMDTPADVRIETKLNKVCDAEALAARRAPRSAAGCVAPARAGLALPYLHHPSATLFSP